MTTVTAIGEVTINNHHHHRHHISKLEHTWIVSNYTSIHERGLRHFTQWVELSGYFWRIFIDPRGSDPIKRENISVYLEHTGLPPCYRFKIELINQVHPLLSISFGAYAKDRGDEKAWGFYKYCEANEILDSSLGFILDDKVIFTVKIYMIKDPEKYIDISQNAKDELTCAICYDIFTTPTEHIPVGNAACSQIYCEKCVQGLRQCPHCRHDDVVWRRVEITPSSQRFIFKPLCELKAVCQICPQIVSKTGWLDHVSTCVYRLFLLLLFF
eukprot:TRINITY_DN4618_c0_g1_i1.p1 TRINITY_DN4618_c0_g1~~TRINITY_DN4618_c0_g1_i1.p1  ORF type:complete len:270 (+),score=37.70 TRINITY_DN4618_c0_g1_i1:135-944(+)